MGSQVPSSSAEGSGSGPGPVPHTAFKAVGGAPDARWGGSTPSSLRTAAPLTLGTAGHIDHGKTALVRALTGVETDRLAEERRRGISIVLGFAPLVLPSGRRVSIVDVPGHERFVRTMVAGSTGIDLFLLVVAADDGVMPQTREHVKILRALGIERGVVAITKTDVATPRKATLQVRELLPDAPVIACSARTGHGIDTLARTIEDAATQTSSRAEQDRGVVLHIDRAFTVLGRGVVVTGTLWSGELHDGDSVVVHPGNAKARVRAIEIHGTPAVHAVAGQRVAVNLGGVRAGAIQQGDALATPATLCHALTLDCSLALDSARNGELVHAHHGTRESPGRLVDLGDGLWQLRLARPLLAQNGDSVLVRRSSPPETLGGGTILDASARRHGRNPDILAALRRTRDGRSVKRGLLPGEPAEPTERASPPARQLSRAALVLEERLRASRLKLLGPSELTGLSAELRELTADGRAVRVRGRLYAHRDTVIAVRQQAVAAIDRDGKITLPALRDELGVSRRVAEAFLEHLDEARVTRRLADNTRVLGSRARSGSTS